MIRGLAALAFAVGCGCGPATPPATFTQVYDAMFPLGTPGQCNYCHNRPPNDLSNGKLDMGETRAAAYSSLVGKPSVSAKCAAMGDGLVVAGSPTKSLLYLKLEPSPACGDRMPQGATPLTAAQLELVRSWISAGAKDD